MDSTQVFFSMQVPVAEFSNSASVVVHAPEIDLGATIFLAAEKSSKLFGGLFFSLHSSLESVMFHVRKGFENVVISVSNGIRKFFCRQRSMWRGRIRQIKFTNILKHSTVLVLRT